MQPKKIANQLKALDVPTFNIRKIFKKNSSAHKNMEEFPIYTPEFEYQKYPQSNTYTNPKKEKDLIIDQSVNEAILISKPYIDLKGNYQESKRKNIERKREMEKQIEKMKTEKKQAEEEQQKLEHQRHRFEETIRMMKQKITQMREKNRIVRQSLQSRMSNEADYLSNLIMSMRFQAEYEHDIDPDQMTYEELLELQEKIGHVSRGLHPNLIARLPKVELTQNYEQNCTVCFSTFEIGEVMTKIKNCKHQFHFQCLSSWLQKEKVCPVCKQELIFQQQQPEQEEENKAEENDI